LRKILYAFLALVAVVIAGLLVGPSFFDWNSYKPQIASAVKEALGRELRIVGDIQISVLPSPALSVKRVSLENVPGADNREMVALEEVEVNVDVSSLLQGKIAVKSVRLVRPVISLEITKDGSASWDIKLPGSGTAAPSPAPTAAASDSSGGLGVDVSLESLKIEDATISYVDARSGLREEISNLTTDIAADSLNGPFRLEGEATVRDIPATFRINVGQIAPDRPLPVNLTLGVQNTQSKIEFKGSLSELTPDATLAGTVKASAANLAQLAKQAGQLSLPGQLAKPLSMDAEVAASATTVGVNKLSLRLGEMSFAGAIHGVLGPQSEIDLVLNANKIDIDPLFETRPAQTSAQSDKAKIGTSVTTKLPTSQPATSAPFVLPKDFSASFDLGVQTATYRGGVIRDATVKGALRDGVIHIERISAALPGSSDFIVSGALAPADGLPQFTGDIAAKSDNLRGLTTWLGVDQSVLPRDRLRNLSYKSALQASPKKAEITGIAVQLDASKVSGGMVVEFRQKPGIGLRLAVDKLNLDAYLPKGGTAEKPNPNGAPAAGKSGNGSTAQEAKGNPAAGLQKALDLVDANVELSADQLTFMGETARNATLSATIFERSVTIRQASIADFAGVGASLAGRVDASGAEPKVGLDYNIAVRNAERLARFAGTKLPVSRKQLGKVSSKGRIDATLSKANMKVSANAAGAQVKLDGAIDNYLANPRLDLRTTVTHPELKTALRKFAPEFRPAAAKLGPLSVRAHLRGTPDDLSMQDIDAKIGPVAVAGQASFGTSQGRSNINANLKTSEVLLDLFLPPSPRATAASRSTGGRGSPGSTARTRNPVTASRWSDDPIGIAIPTDIDADVKLEMVALTKDKVKLEQPRIHAVLKAGRLAINSFDAKIFGGKLNAKAAVEPRGKAAAIAAEVALERLSTRTAVKTLVGQDRVTGPLSVSANLTTSGHSERTFISSLNGNAAIQGQAQFLLTKEERNTLGLAAVGSTLLSTFLGNKVNALSKLAPISQLLASLDQAFGRNPAAVSGQFRIVNGVAQTDNLTLSGQGNVATTRATIDLPRWQLVSATELVDDPQQEPLVTFDASGPLDAPSRTKVGGRLLRSGVSKVQQQVTNPIQKLLPGILGGGSSSQSSGGSQPQTQPQQQQQQQKLDPGSLIQGIFNQLKK